MAFAHLCYEAPALGPVRIDGTASRLLVSPRHSGKASALRVSSTLPRR